MLDTSLVAFLDLHMRGVQQFDLQKHKQGILTGLVWHTTHKLVSMLQLQVCFSSAFSCFVMVQEGSWQSGLCQGHNLADSDRVWAAVEDSLQNKAGSSQRLYFLDGTFPGDLPEGCSTHEDVPGDLGPH